MKITKVDLDSFGSVRGFSEDFDEYNMTLIYGNNEAGKTTIMEFMRTTMFPGKACKYPLPKKTDSGVLTLTMADGSVRVLKREARKVFEQDDKPLPAQTLNMDAETYRSMYALDLDQLTNDKILSDGEFRRRFLTVPGGENVPEVTKSIRTRMDALMSKERMTGAKIVGHYYLEKKRLQGEIYAASEGDEEYDALSAEMDRLNRALSEAKAMIQAAAYEDNKEFMLDSLKKNLNSLEELKAKRAKLRPADRLSDEVIRKEAELRSRIAALDDLMETQTDDSPRETFGTMSAAEVLSMSKEIEDAWAARSRMGMLGESVADLRRSAEEDRRMIESIVSVYGTTPEELSRVSGLTELRDRLNAKQTKTISSYDKAKYTRIIVAGGAVIAAVGVGMAAMGLVIPGAVAAVAGVLAAASPFLLPRIRKRYPPRDKTDWKAVTESYGLPPMDADGARRMMADADALNDIMKRRNLSLSRMEDFEMELEELNAKCAEVCSRLGISGGSTEDDLDDMYSVYVLAKSAVQSFSESEGLSTKRQAAVEELDSIYSRYGGEEDFRRLKAMREEARELDLSISALSEAVESAAGMTSDIITKTVSEGGRPVMSLEDAQSRVDAINVRLGEISSSMKQIRDRDAAADLKIKMDVADAKLAESAREWAVLSLADTIIAGCSDRFYADLQPDVMRTANRYLDLMTEGRYRLASDPRDGEISIEDRRGKKYDGEWSSGLADQVYLSVKMAIAKQMSTEKLPVIMDDVLVRFDARRKQGACRAIMDFARDQQVIMFTCDSTLGSMFRLEGSLKYVKLP